jgi:hypothetical protein
MSMTLPIAEMRITRDLRQAEAALDDALLKQTSLLASLITARREIGDKPFLAQAELMRLVKSQQTLLSASGDLARVHGGLKEIGREYGRVVHECPPNEPIGLDEGGLNDAGEVFPFTLKAA